MMKKLKLSSELVYILAILLLSLAINISARSNLGISMIAAPAYILSIRVAGLSYGMCEYIIEGIIFVLFCILMKKFKIAYLSSFITGILYGAIADLWPVLIPFLAGSNELNMGVRIVLFVSGGLITAVAIALFLNTYFYPQIYDLFTKCIPGRFGFQYKTFKTAYDLTFLGVSILMSYCFFHGLVGVGVGTIFLAFVNGTIINICLKFIDNYVEIKPHFQKLADYLNQEIEG